MANNKNYKKEKKNGNSERQHKSSGGGAFKSCNDIRWYSLNPSLLRDSGQITYGEVLGLPVTLEAATTSEVTLSDSRPIPGIMSINYIPGVGVSKNLNSNLNVASRLVYTFMRHANSGSRNYEAPDYMTYLLAVGNAQLYYSWMVRLYGLINHASIENRYITKALVAAAGGDYENLVKNMASFRYYINYYANKLNSLAVPKDQYIYDRMTFLPLHVFTDGEDPKSQMYIFRPKGIFAWNGTKYETGSALVYQELEDSSDLDVIIQFGDNLLNSLLENEDIGLMSGDTLRAYGPSGIRQVAPIEETYSTPILKDDGILAQIHNSLSLPIMEIDENSLDIVQENGSLKYQITGTGSSDYMKNCFLDCWFKDPDATYNMEATRLVTFVENIKQEDDSYKYAVYTSGSEVVVSYDLYLFNDLGNLDRERVYSMSSALTQTGTNFIPALSTSLLTKFDWHPILYKANVNSSAGMKGVFPIGDLQNYTILTPKTVDKLHNCAIQSLFNVFGLYLKVQG